MEPNTVIAARVGRQTEASSVTLSTGETVTAAAGQDGQGVDGGDGYSGGGSYGRYSGGTGGRGGEGAGGGAGTGEDVSKYILGSCCSNFTLLFTIILCVKLPIFTFIF